MASLMSLLAVSAAPTGQRVMPSLAPSETDRIVPRDGPAPLFENAPTGVRAVIEQYAEVSTPFWESPTFLVVAALIAICVLVALAFFIGKRQSQPCRRENDIYRREQAESTIMRDGLFDAASDITRISAMYNLQDQRRRR